MAAAEWRRLLTMRTAALAAAWNCDSGNPLEGLAAGAGVAVSDAERVTRQERVFVKERGSGCRQNGLTVKLV